MPSESETAGPGIRGGEKTERNPEAAVLSLLDKMAAETPAARRCEAIVDAAAGALGGTASLWRFDKEEPVLLAVSEGTGARPEEGTLASMKDMAGRMRELSGPEEAEHGTKNAEEGLQGFACVPVYKSGEKWGALAMSPGEKGAGRVELLQVIAKVAGLDAERCALHDEVGRLRGRVAASESGRDPMARYARLGQLAGRAYEEISQVIESVEKSLRKSTRVPIKSELEEALSEVGRAKSMLHEQIELARLEMPVLAMSDLTDVVRGAVDEIENETACKRMRLLKRLEPMTPPLLLDSDKVRTAVDKILAAAVTRSEPEGWLKVETESDDGEARVRVTWEEKGGPGAITQDMFVPFGSLGKGGAGLAVATQIIREHGGGICCRRFASGAITMVISIPISGNQDRRRRRSRRSGLDRRQTRGGDE
jgi:signal transduction histidine kinase